MRRTLFSLVLCSLLLNACAATVQSPTVTAFQSLLLAQQAGLFTAQQWIIPGDSHAKYLAPTERWAEHDGFTIVKTNLHKKFLLGHVSYEGDRMGWVIFLNADVPPNTQLYTLFHEIAHAYQPKGLDAYRGEVFAELSASQTCKRLGLDTSRETAAYLAAKIPEETQWAVVLSDGARIDAVVRMLLAAAQG